jgi:pyruvate dehydrogenase E2 component (dihydrolipoamide acetyltransferase)
MQSNPTTRRIELAQGRVLSAKVWPGEGLPIVFLHGMLGSSDSWAEVAGRIERPAVAFDLPGFGGSDLPVEAEVSAYAEDIAVGIEALGLERFELVGHSFGGAVAAAVAGRLAAKVTSLVLMAPAGFGRLAVAEALSLPGLRFLADATLPRLLARRGTIADCSKALVTAARHALTALVAAGRSPISPAYGGRVTTVWGTDDHIVRMRHSHDVVAAFPQADVVLWHGIGHHPQRERLAQVVELLGKGRTARTKTRKAPRRGWQRVREILWPTPRTPIGPRFA